MIGSLPAGRNPLRLARGRLVARNGPHLALGVSGAFGRVGIARQNDGQRREPIGSRRRQRGERLVGRRAERQQRQVLGLDLGEAIDAVQRVGADGRFGRHRPAAGRDSQIDEILRVVPGERPGLAAVGAGVEFGQRRRGGNGKVGVALIREIVGLDDAAGGHRDFYPATSRLATEPICSRRPPGRLPSVRRTPPGSW